MRIAVLVLGLCACGGHGGGSDSPGGDAPSGGPLTIEDLARACENAYGCIAPPIDNPTIPQCLTHLFGGDVVVSATRTSQIRCLAAAGANCTTARACIGYTVEPCSTGLTECRGDILYHCSPNYALELNCRGGLWNPPDSTCVPGSSPACGLGSCTSGGSTTTSCDGTRVVACQLNGVREAFDCAELGETCTSIGTSAGCTGTGAACTGGGHCEGTTMVRCDGGHEQRVDCATMLDGGVCLPIGSGGVSCNFGSDCTTGTATCTGTIANLCVLGKMIAFDCVAEGFASCGVGSCEPATFP